MAYLYSNEHLTNTIEYLKDGLVYIHSCYGKGHAFLHTSEPVNDFEDMIIKFDADKLSEVAEFTLSPAETFNLVTFSHTFQARVPNLIPAIVSIDFPLSSAIYDDLDRAGYINLSTPERFYTKYPFIKDLDIIINFIPAKVYA